VATIKEHLNQLSPTIEFTSEEEREEENSVSGLVNYQSRRQYQRYDAPFLSYSTYNVETEKRLTDTVLFDQLFKKIRISAKVSRSCHRF
jgi:hypothetical protein